MSKFNKYKNIETKKSSKKWKVLAILALLLLMASVAWAMRSREDPAVARAKAMRNEIEQLPRDQRRGKMREVMENLTPEQREAVFADRRAEWQRREKERLKEFFAMSKEEQIAQLDKDIDRMKERMKQWQDKARQRGNNQQGGGGGGGGQGAQSFGRDASGNVGASDRTKNYLNSSAGETRGAQYEYRRMMNDRMHQRGG